MELFIVTLAIGISAWYVVRRLWKIFTRPAVDRCGEGCAGCACAPVHPNKNIGNVCVSPERKQMDGCTENR